MIVRSAAACFFLGLALFAAGEAAAEEALKDKVAEIP
jgi:hypothetical protein